MLLQLGRLGAATAVACAGAGAWLALGCLAFALGTFSACSGPASTAQPPAAVVVYTPTPLDSYASFQDAGAAETPVVANVPIDGGFPLVTSLLVSPLTLVPGFSPGTHDYYVRCAVGENPVVVTVTDETGTTTTSNFDLAVDQAVVVGGQDWIRCLPPDFPEITTANPSDAGSPTPGYYLTNSATYAMVLDAHGTPVWYARGTDVGDVDALQPNTISLLPNGTGGYGMNPASTFQIHALSTSTTTNVQAVGTPTDAHEFRWLSNGDYLLFSYFTQPDVNLQGLGTYGDDAAMADCQIQEINPSGVEVWSWLASDHVDPVTESLEQVVNEIEGIDVIDVFHCNSIDVDASGNLLVSLRHANAVYYIDRSTGQVLWKLGGTPTNKDGATCIQVINDPEGTFSMQHDARLLPNGDISLFDDHGNATGVARGVEYAIDMSTSTATVVWQFLGIYQSQYEGSFRSDSDGESVIGWGNDSPDLRVITEIDPDGNDVLDISFNPQTSPYRGIKVPLSTFDIDLLRLTAAQW